MSYPYEKSLKALWRINSTQEINSLLEKLKSRPFESFAGVVEEFDVEKRKVKISILIFGRATSVELGIEQVEKIS